MPEANFQRWRRFAEMCPSPKATFMSECLIFVGHLCRLYTRINNKSAPWTEDIWVKHAPGKGLFFQPRLGPITEALVPMQTYSKAALHDSGLPFGWHKVDRNTVSGDTVLVVRKQRRLGEG